jgi:archaeosine synthase alpha-subunit
MARRLEKLEGMALLGPAEVGSLHLRTPAVLESPLRGVNSLPPATLRLIRRSNPQIGRRSLAIESESNSLELDFEVPTPEIQGPPGVSQLVGPETWIVRWPLDGGQWERLRAARPALVVLSNARFLLSEGAPFVRAIQAVREQLGAQPILWAPRVALPHRLALLVYLGIDLLDTTEGIWRAAQGTFFDSDLGILDLPAAREERRCDCEACRSSPPASLEEHTTLLYRRETALVRTALRSGRLRELVEGRLTAEPLLAELLRYADDLLGPLLEERTPVVDGARRAYVLAEAQRRPEVARFRHRLIVRYRPPPSKRVLFLLPCSRTKPYRNSPSHRRMARALEALRSRERIHWVSVSSPLGLVPRELEDVFPARNYDIPVTGEWSEGERSWVVDALDHLLAAGQYQRIVAHLDPEEYAFLYDRLAAAGTTRWTLLNHQTTTAAALESLHAALGEALATVPPVPGGPLEVVREELHELAAFQFGRSAADLLFAPPVRLAGRPWFQRLTDARHTDLATWREERGLFQLTVAGGERLLASTALRVEVAPEVPLAGDLFVPGVRDADPGIRVGDAVLLVRGGALIAVGEAELPGRLMRDLDHGLAVRVRHRIPNLVASAPKPTLP